MGLSNLLRDYYKKQQTKRQEAKKRHAELREAWGEPLGRIKIGYAGGLGREHRNDARYRSGYGVLKFYERKVRYAKEGNAFTVEGKDIAGVEVGGQELVTRSFFTGGVTKQKRGTLVIKLVTGEQILFQTNQLSNFDIQQRLADAISHFNSRRSANPQAPLTADPIEDIKKYAALCKQGIITAQEFQAKKKQLLEL